MGSMYSMSAIKSYEPYVDDCVHLLLRQLDARMAEGQSVDLQHWMQCYAFDFIGGITFGSPVGFLESGGQDIDGIMKSLEDSTAFSTLGGIQPLLIPLFFALFGSPVRGIQAFSAKLKNKAAASGGDAGKDRGETFLSKVNQARDRDPEAYKVYHMDVACDGNVAAGSDTTSISLTSALYYIVTTPGVLNKLRDELSAVGLLDEADKCIEFDQAQKLPCLRYCIKEAFRIHPATGLPMWRQVVGEGFTLAGLDFPPGTILGINSWVAHTNTSIYGCDADVFRPERWDPAVTPPEQLAAMENDYLPFGAGTRTCIGKHISHLEMVKLLPELVRRYDFEPMETKFDYQNIWCVKRKSFMCKLRQRVDTPKE